MRIKLSLAVVALASSLSACSTLDALNPFASSAPKMAELPALSATETPRIAWHENIGKSADYVFSPAVVGRSVYVAARNGELMRIDDGQRVWRVNAGQVLSGGVGANENMLVVGSPKGDLLAFSSQDGQLLWQVQVASEILSPPALGGGLVVIRTGDNRVAAYAAADGQRKWSFQRPVPALSLRSTAQPFIEENFVFAGFPGGKLIALDMSNGLAMWDGAVALPKGATELDRVADITSSPVITGTTICAVAFQGRVACFDLKSGNLIWARDMSSAVGLAMDTRYLYVTDDKSAVHALDRASGASIWKQDKLFFRRVGAPVVMRRLVAVADAQGIVHFLNRDDGAFVARLSTDGQPIVAPLKMQGDRLLAQTAGGGIYAIEIE